MYEDKTLICRDCGAEFVFTAGEQAFYAEKGFQNEPSRCKACRDARKANGGARRDDSRPARCTMRSAQSAASPPFPRMIVPSTAASATRLAEKEAKGNPCRQPLDPTISVHCASNGRLFFYACAEFGASEL